MESGMQTIVNIKITTSDKMSRLKVTSKYELTTRYFLLNSALDKQEY